ncbi:MAG: hypothetical protein IJM27_05905 [Eubacterium sp.]|nr:hypothetical protein [Eubacterium sp.]
MKNKMKNKSYLLFPLVISGLLALSILISILGVGQDKRIDEKGAQETTKETAKEEADLTFVKSIITSSLKDEKKQTDSKADTDPKISSDKEISSAAENTWGLEKTAESEVAAELGDMTIVKQMKQQNKKKKQKKEVKSYETVNPTDQ